MTKVFVTAKGGKLNNKWKEGQEIEVPSINVERLVKSGFVSLETEEKEVKPKKKKKDEISINND